MYHLGEEHVRGTIIGDVTFPYQFWGVEIIGGKEIKRKIAKGHFKNDYEAEEWFKEKYPRWHNKGVEMRCYDG